MSKSDQELEVKYYLASLAELEGRLKRLGARLAQPRVHEVNLRFDTPASDLSRSLRVLRLRRDSEARVTFKGPGSEVGGARLRQELEFTVSDFDTARALFEALGYQVYLMYEKYRTTYELNGVLVTLDEMPYGSFAEIEGPDGDRIQAAAQSLGLDWANRILDSYTTLFDRVQEALGLAFRDLSFANFQGVEVPVQALGIGPSSSLLPR
jgi:adenylate cyclase class 2